MYAISSNFQAAIRGPHVRTVTADVYYAGAYQQTLPVVDGTINVDRTQNTSRQGTVTIGNPLLFPTYVTSPLAPYAVELHLNYTVVYPTGLTETCPLGVFPILDVYAEQATGAMPVVDLSDRSMLVQGYPFYTPYDASGTQYAALINKFVQDAFPATTITVTYAASISSAATTTYVPGGTTFSSDRWSAVQSLCNAIGAEAYFDVTGNVQVVPIPSMTQAGLAGYNPVWNFNAGSGGVLVTAKRMVSRAGVYNAVFATGGSSGGNSASPTAFVSDNDPRSPTYFGPAGQLTPDPQCKFGPQVLQWSNTLITDGTTLTAAAQAQLNNYLGLARNLNFTAVPNPALERGDIVKATYSASSYELHVLDSISIPLGPSGQFTGQTRSLTYQLTAGS